MISVEDILRGQGGGREALDNDEGPGTWAQKGKWEEEIPTARVPACILGCYGVCGPIAHG